MAGEPVGDLARCGGTVSARHRHGVRIVLILVAILDSPRRFLIHPILEYVELSQQGDRYIAVLIPGVEPLRWRCRILRSWHELSLATMLWARTDVLVRTLPYWPDNR